VSYGSQNFGEVTIAMHEKMAKKLKNQALKKLHHGISSICEIMIKYCISTADLLWLIGTLLLQPTSTSVRFSEFGRRRNR
jgi:hypothetical protein